MKVKKAMLLMGCLLSGLLAAVLTGCSGEVDAGTEFFSPALDRLACEHEMAMSAIKGNSVVFSKDAFCRSVNLADLSYITVTAVPDASAGKLLIGSTEIQSGQSVSAGNLAQMQYVALENTKVGRFSFTVNGAPYAYTCRVGFSDQGNFAPEVTAASSLDLAVSTHDNLSLGGTLYARDPEGDELEFRVVKYPSHGSVLLTDRTAGTYVYLPSEGYTGKDSFCYVVRDCWGNWSPSAEVEIEVKSRKLSMTYADLRDNNLIHAVLTMAEEGIMSGYRVGNRYYFRPEDSVSKAEFVVEVMSAIGITAVPEAETTAFADTGHLSPAMKGSLSAAYTLGYIVGDQTAEGFCFHPDEPISRAEAAVILKQALGLSEQNTSGAISVFADSSEIPAWATQAVNALCGAGILKPENGKLMPGNSLTRGDAAILLERVMRYSALKK